MGSDSPEDKGELRTELEAVISRLPTEEREAVASRTARLIAHRWRMLHWAEWQNMTGIQNRTDLVRPSDKV